MVDIPLVVKALYATAHKNFRVTFPNGEYSDIIGDRIIAESVRMDESVCSENVFRFGSAERSTISFDVVDVDDLTGLRIACWLDVDLSSLSAADYNSVVSNPGDGQVLPPSDTGLSYTVYSIPWGSYRVETAQRIQGYSNRRHIEAGTLAPWAWSPVERMRLDTWLGASPLQVRSFSPKDMLYANLGFWWPESLTAAGYTQTWVKSRTDFVSESFSFSKAYESQGGGHTYKAVISGTCCRSKLGLSDGLYGLRLINYGDTEAAWKFFLECYEEYSAPYPDVPQPTIPIDRRSPRTWLQPYIGYDLANDFAPGSHSGMSGQFNPCYWIPKSGEVPCLYITTENPMNLYTFFGVMWDLTITFSVDGTVKKTGTFFPSSYLQMNVYQFTDTDPFPVNVEISPSATIAPDSADTSSSEYLCFSDSYNLAELLRSWLELHGQCMGFARNGSPKIWSPADPVYGSVSVPTGSQKFAGFWWDEIPPADVTRVLWSWEYEDDERDMETSIAQVPAEWLEERGSTYDLRGNWILRNLSGVSDPGDVEALIIDLLAPSLLAEASGERIMSFPAIDLTAMAMPWIESGDRVTVSLSSGSAVASFAMSQSVTGIQKLTQTIAADGGLSEVNNE